ncbi:uncharacterized protein [Amphiura filiformis]|uniref:uncharacterized protein n=1 Tax=Amphiura filiformis TaxID=82378 RepID=UPI003B20C892
MRTMNAFGRHVRIQIQEGDITNEDTESLVRFIFPGADDLDGLLDAAGDLVRQEYVQEKAKGGLYVNRGVVCTSAGNIGQVKRLFHVEVGLDEAPAKFITALHTTLRSADKQDLKSIAFPGLALCPDEFLSSFMEVVYEFEECENPRCLRLIRTAIPAERAVEMIQMTKYIDISKQKMENSYFHNNRDQQDERASLEDTDELSKLRDIPGTFTSFTNKHHAVAAEIESYPLQTLTLKQDRSTGTDTLAKEESNCVSEQTTAISSSTFDETGRISHESSFTPMSFSDDINAASASTDATNNIPLIQPNTTAKEEERIIMDAFGRHVHIQIQEGDIINEDTEALVRFIYPGADDVDGLLDAAGDLVRQEYAQEKAKGGLYVNRGVVCTSAGNIGQNKRLFHVEVRLDEGPGTMAKFRTALHTTLRSADRQDLRSIAFPALALHTYRVEILKAYMEVVYEFEDCENPRCLWWIRTVLPAKKAVAAQMDVAVRQKIIERMEKYVEISKDKMKEITPFQNKYQADGSVPLVDTDEQSELYDKNLSEEFEIDSHPLQTVTWNQDHRPGTGIHQDRSPRTDTHATETTTISSSFDETDRISLESSSTPVASSDNINTASSLIQPKTTSQTGVRRRVKAEVQGAIKAGTPVRDLQSDDKEDDKLRSRDEQIRDLCLAAAAGDYNTCKYLLQKGIDVNCSHMSEFDFTPLHEASSNGHSAVCQILLRAGAIVNHRAGPEFDEKTPLHQAAMSGHDNVCKVLLDAGAVVNAITKQGHEVTPLWLAAKNGHGTVCQVLLQAGAKINCRTGLEEAYETTPLHEAAMNGHDTVCKVLLDAGAEVNVRSKEGHELTPLCLAAQNGHGTMCQMLLQAGAIVNVRAGLEAYETTPLHEATANGHDNVCKVLLDVGAEVNVRTKVGHEVTPLWLAAQNGHGTVCQVLLQAGAIADDRAGVQMDETTPLHKAAQSGSDNICKKLLAAGAKVNAKTRKGQEVTPLWLAAQEGQDVVGHILLGAGALVNARAGVQMGEGIALHQAAKYGHDNFCKLLIDAGANVNAKTQSGQEVTPLMTASQHGHGIVCQSLLKAGAIVNARAGVEMDSITPLHLAAQDGRDDVCRILLDAGANINAKTRLGHEITPLWIAAQNGHDAVCRILLYEGAIGDENAGIEMDEKMALHKAAQNGHDNVCKTLLDAGANVNAKTRTGQAVTPLMLASQEGHGTVCQTLLKAGATVNTRAGVEMGSKTPLCLAAQDGRDEVCKILLDAGANATRSRSGISPLLIAAQNGHDAVCRILLEAGAIVNEKAGIVNDERMALHQAAQNDHVNVCKVLLCAGADSNARTRQNQEMTALMIAAQNGLDGICQTLLSAGASVNAEAGVERDRKTALHEAAQYGHDHVCKILLDAGANANAQTMRRQHTPLHLAVTNCELKRHQTRELDEDSRKRYGTVFRLLVEAGADPGILEHEYRTADRREADRRLRRRGARRAANEEYQKPLCCFGLRLGLCLICCFIPH